MVQRILELEHEDSQGMLLKASKEDAGDTSGSQSRDRGVHKTYSPHLTPGQFVSPLSPQERE